MTMKTHLADCWSLKQVCVTLTVACLSLVSCSSHVWRTVKYKGEVCYHSDTSYEDFYSSARGDAKPPRNPRMMNSVINSEILPALSNIQRQVVSIDVKFMWIVRLSKDYDNVVFAFLDAKTNFYTRANFTNDR